MQHLKKTLLAFLVFFFMGISSAQAFSFDFGDDDDYYPYWGPYSGPAYGPWGPPPPVYYFPRVPSYDRSTMVQERQEMMGLHDKSVDRLGEMLYGSYGFDRAEAIKLARKIELTSGFALTSNFHPDAVATYGSHTTPSLWGNEQTFKANALALQAAAIDLAKELEKQPTPEEGAVYLPKRSRSFGQKEAETVPVSAGIWEKYNALSNVCVSCHSGFRGRDW